jgi:hypothetical protein
MALGSALAVIGLGASLVGGAVQAVGQRKAAKASARAEKLRETQMNLEAQREKRKTVREATIARAQALSAGVSQGAQFGTSIQGGQGAVSTAAASRQQGISQGQEIGAGIFQANRDIARAQSLTALGGGISSLGGALFSSSSSFR